MEEDTRARYIIDDGEVYELIKGDALFTGYSKIMPALPKQRPYLSYIGPKISLADWRQVIAFFKWGYDDSKSEVQVRLYFNKEQGIWKPWAFPQRRGTGMTTTELEEKEGDERVKAGIAKGWIEGGTIHSHCAMGAFQSGVDKDNEKTKNGIHITVGKIDKHEYDIHGRVSFKGQFYDAAWANWFEMPEGLTGLPWVFRHDVMKYFLCLGIAEDQKFPEEWKENVIAWTAPAGTHRHGHTGDFRTPQGGPAWGSYGNGRGSGGPTGVYAGEDEEGIASIPAVSTRYRRTKKEKKELRKDLREIIKTAEKATLNDTDKAKLNSVSIAVIKMCAAHAIETDELFRMAVRDPRFLDKDDERILDEYEEILKKAGVLEKEVEDWILELELAGVATEGFYGG